MSSHRTTRTRKPTAASMDFAYGVEAQATNRFPLLIPMEEQVKVLLFDKSYPVAELPESYGITNTKTGVFHVERGDGSVFLCPAKCTYPNQKRAWMQEYQILVKKQEDEAAKESEERRKEEEESISKFAASSAGLHDDDFSDNDSVVEEGMGGATNYSGYEQVTQCYNTFDDASSDLLEYSGESDNDATQQYSLSYNPSPPTPVDANARFVKIEYDVHRLQSQVAPLLKVVAFARAIQDEHDNTTLAYVSRPVNVSLSNWDIVYRSLFGKTDRNGMFVWALHGGIKMTSTNTFANQSSRAGQDNPSIYFSVTQWIESKHLPATFKIENQANEYYGELVKWFVDYHAPYCCDIFKTASRFELEQNEAFHELIASLLSQYNTNVDRTARDGQRGHNHVQSCVARALTKVQAPTASSKHIGPLPQRTVTKKVSKPHAAVVGPSVPSGVQKPHRKMKQVTLTQQVPNAVVRAHLAPAKHKQ